MEEAEREPPPEPVAPTEELQRLVSERQVKLAQLESEVQQLKENLSQVVERKQALAAACSTVLMARSRVELTRQLHSSNKKLLKSESESLKILEHSNLRRNERLKRVRSKNFDKKRAKAREDYERMKMDKQRNQAELQVVRKAFLTAANQLVFPMEVEPLSEKDAGEEDYVQRGVIDCNSALETEDGWMLSGMHTHPTPNIRLVTASAPSNGDYSLYIKAARDRRKAYSESAHKGVDPLSSIEKRIHPSDDPYHAIPAVLSYIAQFVQLISDVLDMPLPYPLSRPVAISEYGIADKRRKEFLGSVAKLDDNIMYLCFSQDVPITALTPGHTLENLLALTTHTQLGRLGAFECHPELTRYSHNSAPTPLLANHYDDDSEPPSLSYATSQPLQSHLQESSSSSSESEEEEEDEGEEGDGMKHISSTSDSTALGAQKKYPEDVEISGWESLDPDPADLKALEELNSSARMLSSADAASSSRERMRRLDYDSTYLDYMTLMGASGTEKSVQLTATDSVRLLQSLDEEEEGLQRSRKEEDGAAKPPEAAGGVFGTLSSLWGSAFGNKFS